MELKRGKPYSKVHKLESCIKKGGNHTQKFIYLGHALKKGGSHQKGGNLYIEPYSKARANALAILHTLMSLSRLLRIGSATFGIVVKDGL